MPRKRKIIKELDDPHTKPVKPNKVTFRVMSSGKIIAETEGIGSARALCKSLTCDYTVLAKKPNGSWRAVRV